MRSALTLRPGFEPGWIVNAHETPKELHKRLPQCKDWYQVAMVRNPWDRAQSQYAHAKAVRAIKEDVSFTEFLPILHEGRFPFMRQQWEYAAHGVRLVKFPYFSIALQNLHNHTGVPLPSSFPHLNQSEIRREWTEEGLHQFNRLFSKEVDFFYRRAIPEWL